MEKKHISYPKIGQFRNIISNINREATFVGLDDNKEAIYNSSLPKPTLTFKGTVKLHGTNASVCFNSTYGFWVQSRNNIITIDRDNAGFAFFAESNKVEFCSLLNKVIEDNQIDTNEFTVSIYGEWAGKGIQKGVGISQLDKAFYIFGVKISKPQDQDFKSYWLPSSDLRSEKNRIYNIEDFKTYYIDVDFNTPELSQNKFIEITNEVEEECPVSKNFGIEKGLGEGVVWSTEYKGTVHRFKVKGNKHSVTKVKKLATVDVEKLNSINEFVEYAVTKNRVDQAIKEVFGENDLDNKLTGEIIRWVAKDILSEEIDTLSKNNLEWKEVAGKVAAKTKDFFFSKIKFV